MRLPLVKWSWNTIPKESLGGYSPYEIVIGMSPRKPLTSLLDKRGSDRGTASEWVDELVESAAGIYKTVEAAQQLRQERAQRAREV